MENGGGRGRNEARENEFETHVKFSPIDFVDWTEEEKERVSRGSSKGLFILCAH